MVPENNRDFLKGGSETKFSLMRKSKNYSSPSDGVGTGDCTNIQKWLKSYERIILVDKISLKIIINYNFICIILFLSVQIIT